MKKISIVLFFWASFVATAQVIEIPSSIYFAGMQLNLNQDLRIEIEKQVGMLLKNKNFHDYKIKLTDTYFTYINSAFEEHNIPTDFKYLVIQESGLQSDAVSSSNAVGFWQFKKETALEVGLIVNSEIDERKHIIAASQGAAKYLKKNYQITSNWLYALIAYNTGLGGVRPFVKPEYAGASEMNLDMNTHWYAIKFLAHKLAYEDKVGYNPNPELSLLAYNTNTKGKTLSEISMVTKINEDMLKLYNKWLTRFQVPDDKDYVVMLPVTYLEKEQIAASLGLNISKNKLSPVSEPTEKLTADQFMQTKYVTTTSDVPLLITFNDLKAIQARQYDTPAKLAFAGGISPKKFFKYNDLEKFEDVKPGKNYYLEEKNNKALVLTHIVKFGETLWDISQKYGIKIKQLIKKNRLEDSEALLEGRILFLKQKRGCDEPIQFVKTEIQISIEVPKTQPQAIVIDSPKVVLQPLIVQPKPEPIEKKQPDIDLYLAPKEYVLPVQNKLVKPFINNEIIKDSAYVYHVVGAQQTLFSISRHYGTKTDSIKVWNNLSNEGLQFDQKIMVKNSPGSLKNSYNTWLVKQTTTLEELAVELKISVNDLVMWNDKKSGFVMQGELIKTKR